MKKHVELEKMSKRAQKEHAAQQRGSWGEISPVTKVIDNKKAYRRSRDKRVDLRQEL